VDKLLPLRIGPRRVVGRETTPTRDDEDDEDEVVVVVVVVVITAVVVDRIAIIVLWRSFFDVRSFVRSSIALALSLCWKLKKKKRRRRHFFTSSFRQVGHSVRRE
jgi:hypothetical protein